MKRETRTVIDVYTYVARARGITLHSRALPCMEGPEAILLRNGYIEGKSVAYRV